MNRALKHRRLRVPRRHGEAIVDPPRSAVAGMIRRNIELHQACDYDLGGAGLRELSVAARRHLLHRARRYTEAYRDCDDGSFPAAPERIFLAGHQPKLFHAGVWWKSFVLSSLARRHGAVGVHLLIDNDTIAEASIRVPGGSVSRPSCRSVPFDRASDPVPFEERDILDRERFGSFSARVLQTIGSLVPDPLLTRFWPLALAASRATSNLGQCLARARHVLEGRWGLATLEVPLGEICDAEPFRWLLAHVLAQLPRFHEIYNASLAEHRRTERIRSRSHPVPDLAGDDDWLEAPFWIWSRHDPRRRRLFCARRARRLVLSDRHGWEATLPDDRGGQVARVVEAVGALAEQGVKLRPRALMTTMYARLFLSDLFLHGIGGAKYDRLTDLLIDRFFHVRAPEFLVLSATMHLPIERDVVAADDLRRVRQLLRDLRYHPERHIDGSAPAAPNSLSQKGLAEVIAGKRRWIELDVPRGQRRQRHIEILKANRALQPYVAAKRRQLLRQRDHLAAAMAGETILGSREYAFCLFPEKNLRNWLLDLWPRQP